MKKLICCLIFSSILLVSTAFADTQVTVTWDANTETDLAGYKLRDNSIVIDTVGLATTTVVIVPDGSHDFDLIAYDTYGNDSIPSAVISRFYDTVAPGQPQNFLATDSIKIQ
jgi:hypothetical protein